MDCLLLDKPKLSVTGEHVDSNSLVHCLKLKDRKGETIYRICSKGHLLASSNVKPLSVKAVLCTIVDEGFVCAKKLYKSVSKIQEWIDTEASQGRDVHVQNHIGSHVVFCIITHHIPPKQCQMNGVALVYGDIQPAWALPYCATITGEDKISGGQPIPSMKMKVYVSKECKEEVYIVRCQSRELPHSTFTCWEEVHKLELTEGENPLMLCGTTNIRWYIVCGGYKTLLADTNTCDPLPLPQTYISFDYLTV